MKTKDQLYSLAYFVLPSSILDWFDIVKLEEEITDPTGKAMFVGIIHIYLDERDNRNPDQDFLRPNGFTEVTNVSDFPIRDKKVVLHIRRRRWLDEKGRSIIINTYPLVAEGTRISPEFAAFLKEVHGYNPNHGSSIGKTPRG